MKKKETILVIIMGILTVAVILMGFSYDRNRKAALLDQDYETVNQTESFEERRRKKEAEKRAAFLSAFDENREESTIADFLQYVKYGKGDTSITFYGDIEDESPMAVNTMNTLAAERKFSEMSLHFVSFIDNENELEANVAEVVASEPDVVFFHLPHPVNGIVDWTPDGLPVEENNIRDVFLAYNAFKEELPETLVVLVTPVPVSSVETEEGMFVSAHQEGIEEVLETSAEYSLPVFNIHDQIMEHIVTNEGTIENLYNEDGSLTTAANELVATLFSKNLRELKVDTTSAYVLDGEPAEIDIVIEEYDLEEEVVEEESSMEETSEEWSEESEVVEEEPVWEAPESESEESSTVTPPVQPTPPSSSTPDPEPTQPSQPIEPIDPPEQPTQPTEPVEPIQPIDPPEQPTEPTEPVDPPQQPTQPTQPEPEPEPEQSIEPPAYEEPAYEDAE